MSNYIKIIQDLQDKTQKNKEELIRLEEKQKNLQEEKGKILAELKELNIKEEELENKIEVMDENLQEEIKKIEDQLK